jgi:hypothetical protein
MMQGEEESQNDDERKEGRAIEWLERQHKLAVFSKVFDVRRATAQGRYAGLKVNCGGVESIIAQREGSANELLVWTLLRA